jgi:16S rRNA G966 N2-methylase RsmD
VTQAQIIDLFAGSGNTLYWLLRHLPAARGVGFESDSGVSRLTQQNIAALGLSMEIQNTDYVSGLNGVSVEPGELVVVFIAPPWGNALDSASGLDLRHTEPPIVNILRLLQHRFLNNRLLCVIQVYEILLLVSVVEVRASFDWSKLRIYDLNAPGQNHGILVGTKGWEPTGSQYVPG